MNNCRFFLQPKMIQDGVTGSHGQIVPTNTVDVELANGVDTENIEGKLSNQFYIKLALLTWYWPDCNTHYPL